MHVLRVDAVGASLGYRCSDARGIRHPTRSFLDQGRAELIGSEKTEGALITTHSDDTGHFRDLPNHPESPTRGRVRVFMQKEPVLFDLDFVQVAYEGEMLDALSESCPPLRGVGIQVLKYTERRTLGRAYEESRALRLDALLGASPILWQIEIPASS